QTDRNGDGIFDLTQNDVTVVNADGSRTQTISDLNSNGSVRDREVTTISADGRTKTTTTDFNGDGVIDLTQVSSMVTNLDGSVTTTQKDTSNNNLLRDETVTTLSADGLSKTTQIDHAGSGTFDVTQTDVTVKNADGSKTQTITDKNNNGSLRDQTVIVRGADGRSRTIQPDAVGDRAGDAAPPHSRAPHGPDTPAQRGRATPTAAGGRPPRGHRRPTAPLTTDPTGAGRAAPPPRQPTVISKGAQPPPNPQSFP